MRKTIHVDYAEGEGIEKYELKGTVVFKRLNFYEKNSVEEESTEIKMLGNIPQVKVSTTKIKELGILKSVVECNLTKTVYAMDAATKDIKAVETPYTLDITGIRELPPEVGYDLVDEYTAFNALSEKKK